MARALRIAVLTALTVLCSAQFAAAQEPIVIPVVTTPEPTNPIPAEKFQTMQPPALAERSLWYPEDGSGIRFPKQFAALQQNGYISLLGSWTIWDPVWDDVGSGAPIIQGSIGSRWQFPLPGKYTYHCTCPLGVRGEGDVYVVGPRPRVNPILTSPDNKPPVSYVLDASASSVTDWKPWNITKYEFDMNYDPNTLSSDGVYSNVAPDQSGPESSVPIALDVPGVYTFGLRVWDNYDSDPNTDGITPRSTEIPVIVIVPKRVAEVTVKPPSDELSKPPDNSAFKRTYKNAKIKLTARGKISMSALRKKGLLVKVSGLTIGDVVTPSVTKGRLVKGKRARKVTSARAKRATGTSVTVRIRLSKRAASILRAKPKAKTMRVAVLVEGSDAFTRTYAKNIAVR